MTSDDLKYIVKQLNLINSKLENLEKNFLEQRQQLEEKFLLIIQGGIGRILTSQQKENLRDEVQLLPCNLDEKKKIECWDNKILLFDKFLTILETGNWREAYQELEQYEINQIKSPGKETFEKNVQCQACAKQIQHRIKPVKDLVRSFLGFFQGTDIANVQLLQFKLSPKELYDEVIAPISNATRLTILLHIFKGYKRFSELKQLTNSGSSVLDHHLRQLIEYKFVRKDSENNYTVTILGEQILKSLTELSTRLK